MKQAFPFRHWMWTLLGGSFLFDVYFSLVSEMITGVLGVFFIVLIYSTVLSLPALLWSLAAFTMLNYYNCSVRLTKIVMTLLAIVSVTATTWLSFSLDFYLPIICYSLAAILSALFLKLKKTPRPHIGEEEDGVSILEEFDE